MNLGAPELLVLLFMGAFFGLPLWGIIDAATRPDDAWRAVGNSRVAWILVQVFLGVIGAVIYLATVRPRLVAASEQSPPA